MNPFKFNPNAKLWTPTPDVEPGFAQTESGLWVPEDYAPWAWNCTTAESAEPPCTLDALKATMKATSEIMEKYADLSDPYQTASEWMAPLSPFPTSPLSCLTQFSASPLPIVIPQFAPLYPTRLLADEDYQRSQTETALADFIPDRATRSRLAKLLWIGTEVCCLNIERANQHWYERTHLP